MEKLKETLRIAFANVAANPARSLLSVTGVVIGIAAVITILALGAGAKQQIMNQLNAAGANMYLVQGRYDSATNRFGAIDISDVERLARLPRVVSASPQLNLYQSVRSRSTSSRAMVNGVSSTYFEAYGYTMTSGRAFSPIEEEQRRPLCVISEGAASVLFPEGGAVGQTLFIEDDPWDVIGVVGTPGKSSAAPTTVDMTVMVPLRTLLRRGKDLSIATVEVTVRGNGEEDPAPDLVGALERNDPHRKGLYQVQSQRDAYGRVIDFQRSLSYLGVLIAAISLLVGGIGMMNVMLTSVAERTREIGVRRAVGATKKDILVQFLVESCLLSAMGGLVGLIAGAALARLLPVVVQSLSSIKPQLEAGFVFLSAVIGVGMGVVFGFYPAVKASRLSPAEALRS